MSRFFIILVLCAGVFSNAWANWQAGERVTLDVKFGFIKAGQAEFLYDPQEGGKYLLAVRAWTGDGVSSLFRLRDRIVVEGHHTDVHAFVTDKAVRELNENDYRAYKTISLQHGEKTQVLYENNLSQAPSKTYTLDGVGRDVFSAMYALRGRAQGIKVGDELTLPVAELDYPYTLVLKIVDKTRIKTHLGRKDVWHIKPLLSKDGEKNKKAEGKWDLWVTADGEYTPVLMKIKMNIGSFTAKVREVTGSDGKSYAPDGLPLFGSIQMPESVTEDLANPVSYD